MEEADKRKLSENLLILTNELDLGLVIYLQEKGILEGQHVELIKVSACFSICWLFHCICIHL